MKKCSKCEEEKPFEEFVRDIYKRDGYTSNCKECRRIENNKPKNIEARKRYKAKNRAKARKEGRKYYIKTKSKSSAKSKLWYKEHTEYHASLTKKWREKNLERAKKLAADGFQRNKKRINQKKKERKNIDPVFKLRINTANLIRTSLRRKDVIKRSKSLEILGCSIAFFKIHIRNQFTEGMSWSNYGKWHLDHIYPTSLAQTTDDVLRLNHYKNFQPLWALNNIRKSNKI